MLDEFEQGSPFQTKLYTRLQDDWRARPESGGYAQRSAPLGGKRVDSLLD